MSDQYHSGLSSFSETDAQPCERFESGSLLAITHDFMAGGFPKEMLNCGAIYSEPPWSQGFKVFNSRVDDKGRDFREFMAKVDSTHSKCPVPCYVLTGKWEVVMLKGATFVTPIYFSAHRVVAWLASYGPMPPHQYHGEALTSDALISILARKYQSVGDWCCGYGKTGKIALREGSSAVLSDFNPKCIGHIKKESASW